MARPMLMSLAFVLALFAYSSVASAEIVEHSLQSNSTLFPHTMHLSGGGNGGSEVFVVVMGGDCSGDGSGSDGGGNGGGSIGVQNLTISPLCKQQVITAANGSLPGPTIQVHEGDSLIVHVFNKSPYNLTIHWHGVFQLWSGWADGPEYVTQCPIVPGNKYTYKFTITGEWWNANIMDIENQALADGYGANISEAFTINGQLGDLYNCSSFGTYKLKVVQGKIYLLRIINVALYSELFFKIANHTMTVVAVDACYTNPMVTDVIVIAPGQTIDVLLTADQPLASYYMAAHCYDTLGLAFDKTTTKGIIMYENASSSNPPMPALPAFNDTHTAFEFFSSLTSLVNGPHWAPVPLKVDEHMFLTEGLGMVPCGANNTCGGWDLQYAASMNNESFELPTKLSMLEASYYNLTAGIYTADFPKYPLVVFDYTNTSNAKNFALIMTQRSTKVTELKYNSTVQIVFQNTALVGQQSHPIHLHGFNFFVLAQGFGNYDPITGSKMFNLINPQIRNTVGVPVGGWTVIRFTANNPGFLVPCFIVFAWFSCTVCKPSKLQCIGGKFGGNGGGKAGASRGGGRSSGPRGGGRSGATRGGGRVGATRGGGRASATRGGGMTGGTKGGGRSGAAQTSLAQTGVAQSEGGEAGGRQGEELVHHNSKWEPGCSVFQMRENVMRENGKKKRRPWVAG
ncbi:hypothetical protein RHMOL_Rhmol05G0283600 [Rhododendron molle]|uniref:Uncharacterized protein n=1 Tax=Rhododendron molle TaxID=49168 RepID=A0ACC0NV01_RHOML|nr:hypothetical protein RHMOL_Rhmol05G0283600 [Rhododendron molle]